MSALSEEIHRSFSASEHAVPVTSPHRPLGRRQLGGWSVLAQAVSTTAPAASMVMLATMMHRVLEPIRALVVVSAVILGLCLIAACLAQLTARMAGVRRSLLVRSPRARAEVRRCRRLWPGGQVPR